MVFVIVRYSEIALKGSRRRWFERKLEENIKYSLGSILKNMKRYYGRMVLEVSDENLTKTVLRKIFGIKSFSFAEKVNFETVEELVNKAFEYFKDKVKGKKFKVECNRIGRHDFTSYDVKVLLGSKLSKLSKVDVKDPDVICWIEIRDKEAYFFTDIIKGPGGLPIGTEGKVLSLVSGGYDSIVASWFLMKRGCKVDFIFFNQGSELQKYYVLNTIKKISEWSIGYENRVFIVDFLDTTLQILKKVRPSLALVVFRKAMYYVSEKIALEKGYSSLVTGESLGQKSSQTAENIFSAEFGIKIPIFRPLIGLDKDEIIKISQDIGTYEYSSKVPELCSLLSTNPKVKTSLDDVLNEFEKIKPLLENLRIEELKISEIDGYLNKISDSVNIIQNPSVNFDEENRIKIFIGKRKIPGAISLSFHEAYDFIKKHGKNNKYLLICERGVTSYVLAEKLKQEGYDVQHASFKELNESSSR